MKVLSVQAAAASQLAARLQQQPAASVSTTLRHCAPCRANRRLRVQSQAANETGARGIRVAPGLVAALRAHPSPRPASAPLACRGGCGREHWRVLQLGRDWQAAHQGDEPGGEGADVPGGNDGGAGRPPPPPPARRCACHCRYCTAVQLCISGAQCSSSPLHGRLAAGPGTATARSHPHRTVLRRRRRAGRALPQAPSPFAYFAAPLFCPPASACSSLQAYYYESSPTLSNEEFDNLKSELVWEGSKVVVLR